MNVKIEKLTAPVTGFEEILDWLAKIFGEGEKKLEYPQLSGAETSFNDDVIFKATDGGKILGSVHVTIPRADPTIAGVSAMFTTPEARGRGVGRIIFSEAIAYLDSIGVKTAFLGTGAPIAEKLYASLGFRYLYGSGVMFRSTEGAPVDFYKRRFSSAPSRITVAEGDCGMRIPIIPLALAGYGYTVYDSNLSIFNPNIITQYSCMGLYQRYIACRAEGGSYFSAYDESGVLGAAASVVPDGTGEYSFDAFFHPSFEGAFPELFDAALSFLDTRGISRSHIYMNIARCDSAKQALARSVGLNARAESVISKSNFYLHSDKYYL